jgi:PTH1 family peptidyl-tRNA hydrolase
VRRFGIEEPGTLVIIHDELDLPPGRLKVKVGGGTAGHNGLKSIQAHLHANEFVRIRIGIGKPPSPEAGADYVLRRPSARQRAELEQSVAAAADLIELLAQEGVDVAMNRANG